MLMRRESSFRALPQEVIWQQAMESFEVRSLWLLSLRRIPIELKVRGLLLSYPVITADPRYQHLGSFENLLGEKRSICEDAMSLERQVTHAMPPCFIWHTAKDGTVPVKFAFDGNGASTGKGSGGASIFSQRESMD